LPPICMRMNLRAHRCRTVQIRFYLVCRSVAVGAVETGSGCRVVWPVLTGEANGWVLGSSTSASSMPVGRDLGRENAKTDPGRAERR